MEFGRVPEKELRKIDFSLPKEPAFNGKVLKGKPSAKQKVYLGCAKWGRPEWVGKIYPAGTKEKDFLKHYVRHYNSIELNATHYKVYGPAGIIKWAEKAKELDFVFCPKMYQGITHRGNLKGKTFILNEFTRGILAFGKHLGPVFIQVNERFTPNRMEELTEFLQSLPREIEYFLEVRHPAWFSNPQVVNDLFGMLRRLKIGAVITDTAGRRDCAHMHLPTNKAFIRFVGNSLHPTDTKRIDEWVKRIKFWLSKGIREIYFFMHMHDEAKSPELTIYMVDRLNKECGLNLPRPEFVTGKRGKFS